MSSKPSKRDDRKTAAPEKHLTRTKSNEIKRRLRNTEKSRKRIIRITNLLRSPSFEKDPPINKRTKMKDKDKISKKEPTEKDSKKTTDSKGNAKKETKSKMEDKGQELFVVYRRVEELEELVPEKGKKRGRRKKMVLKPASGLKIACNKRKMTVPQKATSITGASKRARSQSPDHSQSMEDLRRPVVADNNRPESPTLEALMDLDSMTDEDLLEILTCESPVWWEEAPGEDYTEDPIPRKIIKSEKVNTDIRECPEVNETNRKHTELIDIPQSKVIDNKFMKKRSKLENLLGNIKNKLSNEQGNTKNTIEIEQSQVISKKNNKIVDKPCVTNESEINIATEKPMQENIIQKDGDNSDKPSNSKSETETHKSRKKLDSKSESSESDDVLLHFANDEMLKDFENIEIPVEGNKEHCGETIVIDDDTAPEDVTDTFSDKITDLDVIEINPDGVNKKDVSEKPAGGEVLEETFLFANEAMDVSDGIRRKICVPKDTELPKSPAVHKLTITSIQESSSPISVISIVSDVTDTNSFSNTDNLDTISDTNIKFVDEDDSIGGNSTVEETSAMADERTPKFNEKIDETNNFAPIDDTQEKFIENNDGSTIDAKANIKKNIKYAKENSDRYKKEIIAKIEDRAAKIKQTIEGSKKTSFDKKTIMFRLKQAYKELCVKKDTTLDDKHENMDKQCKDDHNAENDNKLDTCEKIDNKIIVSVEEKSSEKVNDKINVSVEEKSSDMKSSDQRLKTSTSFNEVSAKSCKDTIHSNDITIVNNQKQKIDQSEIENTKINSFYKKCKNSNQRRLKHIIAASCKTNNNVNETEKTTNVTESKVDVDVSSTVKDKVKSVCNTCDVEKDELNSCSTCDTVGEVSEIIVVSDSTVKYCRKCSSIFDTDTCGYCIRKNCNVNYINEKSNCNKKAV